MLLIVLSERIQNIDLHQQKPGLEFAYWVRSFVSPHTLLRLSQLRDERI